MPASLNEQTQFTDTAGKPLVSGKVYFGVQNADPTVSPITIYSDRELTTVIANPQVLDSYGRTTNKVWVAGRYSIRVDDLNDVQQYQELDNGAATDKGVTVLDNVSGANTIVADAATTIIAYEDLEQYTFRTVSVNTDAITLNIDAVGATAVVKNHDQPILPGEFEADQNVIVSYNSTDDVFEWVNQNVETIAFYQGADIATATQPNIWGTDGNLFHFTGTTTVVDLANAPNIGAGRTAIADGAFTLTHGSGITLEGSANIEIAVGDRIEFLADALDAFSAWVTRADGTPIGGGKVIQVVNVMDGAVATGTTIIPFDDTIPQNTEGDEYMTLAITPTDAANKLKIEVTALVSSTLATTTRIAALFQDSTANALAAISEIESIGAGTGILSFTHYMAAGTTSATTFKVRIGPKDASTITFNGFSSGRLFGGVAASSITITEIAP